MAADIRSEPSGPRVFFIGLAGFVAFELVAYFLLSWLTSGLGESNQMQPENTIVRNWVKTTAFLLGHLTLVVVALLVLSNLLPRHFRGQIMRWFLLSLVVMFLLLWPLFD
jgi:RsiW-degrading membrane proteinase PrsW (M82 family)